MNEGFRWLDGLWLGYNLMKGSGMQGCWHCVHLDSLTGLWCLWGCRRIYTISRQSGKQGVLSTTNVSMPVTLHPAQLV